MRTNPRILKNASRQGVASCRRNPVTSSLAGRRLNPSLAVTYYDRIIPTGYGHVGLKFEHQVTADESRIFRASLEDVEEAVTPVFRIAAPARRPSGSSDFEISRFASPHRESGTSRRLSSSGRGMVQESGNRWGRCIGTPGKRSGGGERFSVNFSTPTGTSRSLTSLHSGETHTAGFRDGDCMLRR